MTPKTRKLIAVAVLLPALGIYLFAAAALADLVPANWFLQLLFFVVAGFAWALPLRPLFRWLEGPPPVRRDDTTP